MKVFVFDLLPYGENLEHLKNGARELPWPLAKQHFNPEVAVRTYAEHLEAWEELDRLGFDGVAFNEHHTSPYGLMNSPNLLAAAATQRTKRLKLLVYGNLLPLHEPLRLAEELAMLDCMSNGRLISGFARGIPREHNVYDVPQPDSRARFEEAWEIIRRAWTEEVFSYEGRFWSCRDLAIGDGQQRDDRVGGALRHSNHAGRRAQGRARGHHALLRKLPRVEWLSAHTRTSDYSGKRVRCR
jgi:alkanesulfonate monooxygenase SsuD/methylene tetrahydromethanopterin reductase-like flavin-dependent oxidoreductase (luciferase family)